MKMLTFLLFTISLLSGAYAKEPWSIDADRSLGKDDELCINLKHTLSQYTWSDDGPYWAVVQSAPYLREPPWEEVDTESHKDLIFKLLKLSFEGLDGFFGKAPQRNPDEFYQRKARDFASSKRNKIYVLRKRLLGSYDFGEHLAPAKTQVFVQLRNYEDFVKNEKETQPPDSKKIPQQKWNSLTFMTTEDLSEPDPNLNIGLINNLLRTTIFLYKDHPYIFSADQYIAIPDEKNGFLTYCVFKFQKGK